MNDSPVFIVGCPRSGTTLLRNLLRSHPGLTFPPESHFIPALWRGYGDPRDQHQAVELARRILGLEWIRLWNLTVTPDEFTPDRSFRAVVCRVFEAWARQENKPRWGDKTPENVTDIPALVEIFPAGKVLHIIRDGRDVALSWLKGGFGPRNLLTAAQEWKRYVTLGREAGMTLTSTSYREIRYDALLRQPVDAMRAVCAFIGEPFSDAVLLPDSFQRVPHQTIIGRRPPARVPRTQIDRTNFGKWKTGMSASQRVLFESVAGDLLVALDYETEGVRRRISLAEERAWGLHDRFWRIMRRLNTKGAHRWLLTDWKIRRPRQPGRYQ